MSDIEYTTDGLFARFYANTIEGEKAWSEMEKIDGGSLVFSIHLPAVLSQLRRAGYSVRKSKPIKISTDNLLAELEK